MYIINIHILIYMIIFNKQAQGEIKLNLASIKNYDFSHI